jgi:hypothetical protein
MEGNLHTLPQMLVAPLPQTTFHQNIDKNIRVYNYAFPPHTVTPEGTSLEKHLEENSVDLVKAVQVRVLKSTLLMNQ